MRTFTPRLQLYTTQRDQERTGDRDDRDDKRWTRTREEKNEKTKCVRGKSSSSHWHALGRQRSRDAKDLRCLSWAPSVGHSELQNVRGLSELQEKGATDEGRHHSRELLLQDVPRPNGALMILYLQAHFWSPHIASRIQAWLQTWRVRNATRFMANSVELAMISRCWRNRQRRRRRRCAPRGLSVDVRLRINRQLDKAEEEEKCEMVEKDATQLWGRQ